MRKSAITSRGQTAGDHLADCLYRAATLWLPGHKLRKDYSDGDPDWESDFYILKNTLCAAALTENLFHGNADDLAFLESAPGRYISENSRSGYWGTGALEIISVQLKEDLPGLMGFGVSSLKNMRIFYEAWSIEVSKSTTVVGDLQVSDSEPIASRQPQLANYEGFPLEEFFAVPFTHHIRILEKVKDRDARLFYRRRRLWRQMESHKEKDCFEPLPSKNDIPILPSSRSGISASTISFRSAANSYTCSAV